MPINIDLLKDIVETPGAPGFEKPIRDYVKAYVEPFVDKIEIDNMGNLIAIRKGKSSDKKIMAAAHMDEIGFIVKYIDDNGFVKFLPLGGFDPKTLTSQRVIIHGKEDVIGVMGSKPIHIMKPEERTKAPKLDDYFIDLGLPKEEVEKLVSIGDPITRRSDLLEMGDNVNCKSLDNRLAVFILAETLREMHEQKIELPFDFYGTFTVQEEVGLRGAIVASHHISPDFSFCIDTTIAFDVPGSKPDEAVSRLGDGAGIKVMDASSIIDYRMVKYMRKVANENNIKWQHELLPAGGTDTAAMQRMSTYGTIAGAVSIPTRHIHQVIEMANKHDIRGSIDLLKAAVANVDTYDWSH